MAPLCRPRANIHQLVCAPRALQKSTHFWDPSKSTPLVAKSPIGRPLDANGSILHTFWIHFGNHFSSYFRYFSEPLKTWILQYLTTLLLVLSIQKALILGPLFYHFFDPILGPPLEEPFGPPWPPKVPTLVSPCRFWTLFGTPLGSKMAAWGTQGVHQTVHKTGPGRNLCPEGVPRAIFIDFGTPLGGQGAHLGPPWATEGAFLGPLG